MLLDKNKLLFAIWLISYLVIFINELIKYGYGINIEYSLKQTILESFYPLFFCFILFYFNQFLYKFKNINKYLLFFIISFFSALGITQTLTGSHSTSNNYLLTGLSFYTTSIAFLMANESFNKKSILIVSNPLLLVTGPIAVFFKISLHKSFKNRFNYYFPYIIVGLFLHQTVATPLTKTFFLINETDVASSLTFGLLFELFVYANFCGLSLLILGLFGVFGIKIPLNFKQPFSANNIIDFWKGWHTSLSIVLKTLFYNPIKSKLGGTVAIFAVYISSALWHGVSFNFVIWGLFHAFIFVISLAFLRRKVSVLPLLLMLIGSVVGRLIFADSNTTRLLEKLKFHFTDFSVFTKLLNLDDEIKISIVLALLFVSSEFLFKNLKYFKNRNYKFYRLPVVQVFLLFITIALLSKEMGMNYAVYGQR